mmetsp:Transcript_6195/g.16206  ORF Transcript_6195/g.16206 Transcript_6195/m.16206 type:complete len:208 (+) Transcript_6195:319-942(+)
MYASDALLSLGTLASILAATTMSTSGKPPTAVPAASGTSAGESAAPAPPPHSREAAASTSNSAEAECGGLLDVVPGDAASADGAPGGCAAALGLATVKKAAYSASCLRPSFSRMRRRFALTHRRISVRALPETTRASHSGCGSTASDVMTSIRSPLRRGASIGCTWPLTRADSHVLPREVWIAYAKSRGVAPRGRRMTSPRGVKQKS